MMKKAYDNNRSLAVRIWTRLLVMLLPFLTVACIPEGVRLPESPLLRQLERKSGLIAYVGTDFNIYTIDQAGGNKAALTSDARRPQVGSAGLIYQFPVWSPDGNKVAFVGITGLSGEFEKVSLFTNVSDGSDLVEISRYEDGLPYYLYWSPDSSTLSFLARNATSRNQLLNVVSADGGEIQLVDSGTPYYWSWAPDASQMLIHAGGSEQGRLSLLNLNPYVTEVGLEFIPSLFQAPAWSPDGERLLLAIERDGRRQLILANRLGRLQQTLTTFSGSIAFAWAPDGKKLAYIVNEDPTQIGVLGPLTVVDLENPDEAFTTPEELVLAFFWSPDSQKLAYFEPVLSAPPEGAEGNQAEQQVLQQVHILELEKGEAHIIATFLPTDEFLSRLPYFDQYHHSVTFWSPDSKSLVLSGVTNTGAPTIWVVAASGNLEPRFLTDGRLAYWSWK